MKKNIFFLFYFFIAFQTVNANIKLPIIFSQGMVLQRGTKIPIWGWADAKEKIQIKLNGQVLSTKANADGTWKVWLNAEEAGGPYTLEVAGKNLVSLNDVYVGDVWVCSGQSNMEMKIADWGFINNYKQEIANANFPKIRQFEVQRFTSTSPEKDLAGGKWEVCSPETAGNFSATAYFFARKLYQELNVPIGLINASWGGTNIETWISKEAFQNNDEFKAMISKMPNLNIKEMLQQQEADLQNKLKSFQPNFPPTDLAINEFKTLPNNKELLRKMYVPKTWEEQGLENLNGKVWFRKVIDMSQEDVTKVAIVNLGLIDDNDETYINGIKVGTTIGYNVQRQYSIPAGTIKAGKNVVSVLVDDTGGGGGITGKPEDINLTIGSKIIPLAGDWEILIQEASKVSSNLDPNSYPTLLYNSMIHPITNYAIKGAIWYQGEANVYRAKQYQIAFPLLINDWRKQWKQGDFPFYFVQLSSWNEDNGNSVKGSLWAELREAQAFALKLPNTGMAITTDIGDSKDIHPKNKQGVGKRLAEIALNKTFSKQNVYTGPTFASFKLEGDEISINFDNVGTGLYTSDKYGYIKGFEVADEKMNFHYAKAKIINHTIVLYDFVLKNPVVVRYSWADDAGESNLFNNEGFPAAPFRTDNWKGITDNKKYEIGK